ncbi:MFS general substrate transporter [Phanerochaete sordida]|uniref:MFS general substrate transporter n=1 Tax=Phanerochaete sordida TaxID=48140 RepID=A0A9P3FZF1_9APHY|nr:MFS general substrate transporter [Phanerochaete sordida]
MDDHSPSPSFPDKEDSGVALGVLEDSEPALPNNSKVWWKIDLIVLPAATVIFFLQFLDKGNIGNARVAGLQQQLKMSNTQYSMALTVQYIPYILIDLPANLILKRVGGNIFLATMVMLWGTVTTLQGTVTSYSGLLACRFFLGLFEGNLYAGLTLYLSSFYPRLKLQLRISIFFAGASLAATFLTVEEKEYISAVLKHSGVVAESAEDDEFSWHHVAATLKKPNVLILMLAGFFNGTTLAGLAFFTPSIVAGLGYTNNQAQLMTVPPFAVAFVLSLITSFLSDHFGRRGITLFMLTLLSTAGFAVFLGATQDRVRYGALFLLLPGTYASAPTLGTWPANNAAPHTRRATALGAFITATNSGAILSTWLFGALSPAPRYTSAAATLLAFDVGILLCTLANVAYLSRCNTRKREARAHLGERSKEDGKVGDDSAWFEYTL